MKIPLNRLLELAFWAAIGALIGTIWAKAFCSGYFQ